jgi:hypothetical protein
MTARSFLFAISATVLIVLAVPVLLAVGAIKPIPGSLFAHMLEAWEFFGLILVPALFLWLRRAGGKSRP